MVAESANVVLIVSGLNVISEAFHEFPHSPVGIVEIVHERRARVKTRSKCERYCELHQLAYARVSQRQLHDIAQHLSAWQATLVVTHSVPILPMSLVDSLLHGGINLHHSKLPAYRGGNPLLWQVIEAEPRIGVSVHVLSANADEGAVLACVEFDRPGAVSKQALVNIANRSYGIDLIKHAIPACVDGSITPREQPKLSPTLQANHFPFENLTSVLAERAVSLIGLWDVVCFLGYWPPESLPSRHWCSWFRWVPESVIQGCADNHSDGPIDAKNAYEIERVGSRLHLRHHDGCVVFRPRLHWRTVLAKLLL